MFKYSVIFFGSFILMFSCKLNREGITTNIMPEVDKTILFPLDWIGKYEGRLYIDDGLHDTSSIKMALHISTPNSEGFYPWTLIYGENDYRYYGLESINPDIGHFRIDEYNGIKLDAFLRKNHFISRFTVEESDIIVDYERTDAGITIRFYISSKTPINTTGGETIEGEDVPHVDSYPLTIFQKAHLTKTED